MAKINSKLTGAAGEHYVAFKLSSLGIIVALPREGSPSVDILASDTEGNNIIAIQVKTTDWATRERGRGSNKKPYELQFPLGYKSGKKYSENLIFAFVDLNNSERHEVQPDVYFVPSKFVYDYCQSWIDNVKMVRFHISIEIMAKFKNNFDFIAGMLK